MAIERGPFMEDQAEVAAFFDSLVESLAPRDAVEAAQARSIAATHVRLRRLDRFEAAALNAVWTTRKSPSSGVTNRR